MSRLSKKSRKQLKRAYLEAGKITKANKDFIYASSNPFENLVYMDRATARSRARWLSDNNPFMDNIDRAIINNVFGRGIFLNTKNKSIFKQWSLFEQEADISERFILQDIYKIILKRRMVDGEIFIRMYVTSDGLKLGLIEADQLSTLTNKYGMDIDHNTGKVIRYYFRKVDGQGNLTHEEYTVPADEIINYFVSNRPTQYRGITEYAQVILDIKNLQAFTSATIESKRAQANVAYAIKTTGNFQGFGANIDDDGEMLHDVNGASVYYLGAGEDIETLNTNKDGTDYNAFTESVNRAIAVGRNISYELAARDYSKTNFAASKASILQDYKRFDAEQTHFTRYVLNRIYKKWFEVESLRGNIRAKYEIPEWNYPKREFVDPVKDMIEIEKKLSLNMTSLSDVVKEVSGRNLEDVAAQIAEDKKLLEKYGITQQEVLEKSSNNK